MACFFACNVYIFLFSSRSLTLLSDEFVQKKGANKIICTSKYILEDTNMENERKIKTILSIMLNIYNLEFIMNLI